MRKWYKYFINYDNDVRFLPKDSSFEDHKRSMQGYDASNGYGSKEDFFRTHFHNAHSRHGYYHDYLKTHLKKGEEIFSMGSGRCVNELLLIEDGFNVTCSDLEQACKAEVMRLFPHLRFVEYDVTKGPAAGSFDVVIALSMFYLFDEDELYNVFRNVAGNLKPGGRFIIDVGAAENNIGTWLIDNVICPSEMLLIQFLNSALRKRKCVVTKKFAGYRNRDTEIISIAKRAGLALRGREHRDYFNEFGMRSTIFGSMPRPIVELLGRSVPYVRLFEFQKTQER